MLYQFLKIPLTSEQFGLSILILFLIFEGFALIYGVSYALFTYFHEHEYHVSKPEVQDMIDKALEKERKRTNSNSLNALKSKNKLKSTKSGRQ